MKKSTVYLAFCLAWAIPEAGFSQQAQHPFPQQRHVFSASLAFHSIGLPGVALQEQLKQPGIEAGIGRMLNRKGSLLAHLQSGYQRNRYNGSNTYATANLEYAPAIYRNLRGSLSVGAGMAAHTGPSASWHQQTDGTWSETRNTKFGPVAMASLGFRYKVSNVFAPMVRYKLLVAGNYNQSIPLLPVSAIQIGNQFTF